MPFTPSSRARETPTAAPRALNAPVGSTPSSFIRSVGTPSRAPAVGRSSSGVIPSPQADHVPRIADGEQLGVSPQRGSASGDVLPAERAGDPVQLVARQQR